MKLQYIMDINPDSSVMVGENPDNDPWLCNYYSKAGKVGSESNGMYGELASICKYAEDNKSGGMYAVSGALSYIWEAGGIRQGVNSNTGAGFGAIDPSTMDDNSIYKTGYNYTRVVKNNPSVKPIRARILIIGYGYNQYSALLYAEEAEIKIPPLNKYIEAVSDKGVSPVRAPMDNNTKNKNPVKVDKEDVVTFKILIDNSKSDVDANNLNFRDQFDTSCFEATADFCSIEGEGVEFSSAPKVNASGLISATIKKIPKKKHAFVTVKLKVKKTVKADGKTIYKNGATVGNGWSYDYVIPSPPDIKIDKYIINAQGPTTSTPCGETRANKQDSYKQANPVKIKEKGTEITYKIVIKNEGKTKQKLKYSDTFDAQLTQVSGTFNDTFELEPEKTKEYQITLKYDKELNSGLYVNTAKVTIVKKDGTDGDTVKSSDWVTPKSKDDPKIKKYITDISGYGAAGAGNRADMSEAAKAGSPVYGGNITEQAVVVTYTVEITNTREEKLTGVFSDVADASLNISAAGTGTITFAAKETKTFKVTGTLAMGSDAGTYQNTARFEFEGKDIESSDWFYVKNPPKAEPPKGYLKKYISSVSGGDIGSNMIGGDRSDLTREDKILKPVEVSKGTLITYTIELECNNINYENTCVNNTQCGPEPPCDEGHDKLAPEGGDYCYFDLRFKDTFDKGLEFVNVTGYNAYKDGDYIVLKNLKSEKRSRNR